MADILPLAAETVRLITTCLCSDSCQRIMTSIPCLDCQINTISNFTEEVISLPVEYRHGEKHLAALMELYEKGSTEKYAGPVKLLRKGKPEIIGVTGPIGVGKTVLLKKFYNKFKKSNWRSPWVIFVDEEVCKASTSADDWIREVQRKIANELKIPNFDHTDRSIRNRAQMITRTLQWSSFVFIIDNVMPGARLDALGIPSHHATCGLQRKIVFSAWDVISLASDWLEATFIELSQMDEATSWEIFSWKYKSVYSSFDINAKRIGRQALQLCNGLPEPIIYLAREMAQDNRNNMPKQLQDYLQACMSSLSIASPNNGSFDYWLNVILPPHMRYDSSKDTLRSCFLFCSILSSHYAISTEDLINYWICEGLFGSTEGSSRRHSLTKKAERFIQHLLHFRLLQSADEHKKGMVKIAYVYKKAALLIADEKTHVCFDDSTTFPHSEFNDILKVQRASFINSDDEELDGVSPRCPDLTTLIMSHNSRLRSISNGFFDYMPKLRVLDLSYTSIREIATGIYALENLCSLNLSFTHIRNLPIELEHLDKLENLNLEGTKELCIIPTSVFCHLSKKLHVLKMNDSYNSWTSTIDQEDQYDTTTSFLQLQGSQKLEYLAITINSETLLPALVGSQELKSFTKHLHLKGCSETHINIASILVQAPKLTDLSVTSSTDELNLIVNEDELRNTPDLETIFLSGLVNVKWARERNSSEKFQLLSWLTISKCNKLEHVSWILSMPMLKYLSISCCEVLRQLLIETLDSRSHALSLLKVMTLETLPELTSICQENDNISFRSLESLCVSTCSKLTKLSLPVDPPEKLKLIQGEQSWWENLDLKNDCYAFVQYDPVFRPRNEARETEGRSGQVCRSSACCF